MREPRRVLALAAHVVEHEHDADDAPGAVADRRGGVVDRDRSVVAARAARRCRPSESCAPSTHARATGSAIAIAGRFVLHREHRRQRNAVSFVVAPARQSLGNGVHVLDVARRVDGDHRIGDRRERHLRALLLLQRLRFGALAIRDVGERARHPLRLAALAQHRAAARAKPAILAVVHAQPELEIERIAAREMLAQPRERRAPVGRGGHGAGTCRRFRAAFPARSRAAPRTAASNTVRGSRGSSPRCRRWSR